MEISWGRGGVRCVREPTRQQMLTREEGGHQGQPQVRNMKDSIFLIDFGLEKPRQGRVVGIAQEVF